MRPPELFQSPASVSAGMKAAIEICLLLVFAVPITVMDIRRYRIPDVLTLSGILFFVVLNLSLGEATPASLALRCGVGFGLFWLIHRFSKGKMGIGDAKYSALIAVAAGLLPWLVTVFIASLAGVAFGVVMIGFFHRDRQARIPFAPFLTVGAVSAMLLKGFYAGQAILTF